MGRVHGLELCSRCFSLTRQKHQITTNKDYLCLLNDGNYLTEYKSLLRNIIVEKTKKASDDISDLKNGDLGLASLKSVEVFWS